MHLGCEKTLFQKSSINELSFKRKHAGKNRKIQYLQCELSLHGIQKAKLTKSTFLNTPICTFIYGGISTEHGEFKLNCQ
jgi:hypothetical protein